MNYQDVCGEIHRALSESLPRYWDGRETISFMRDNGSRNWRQMEWPGWYFQFQCERILKEKCNFEIPGPAYGKVVFDGFRVIPWDFKVHTDNLPSRKVPTNGFQEVVQALRDYESVGFIIDSSYNRYSEHNSNCREILLKVELLWFLKFNHKINR